MADNAPPEPITLAQACAHLRIDAGDDDDTVTALIAAAREHVEKVTGLVLTERTVVEPAGGLGRWIELDAWPIADGATIAVSYLDDAGAEQQVPETAWRAARARRPVRLYPSVAGWGVSGALAIDAVLPVSIKVDAGYAPEDVPPSVRAAMLLLIGHWFRNREAVVAGGSAAAVELPLAVDALLRPFRVLRV